MEVVLFGSHWGHNKLYRKDPRMSLEPTANVAMTCCWKARGHLVCARTQCVLVDSTNLGCFVKGLWQVELIVPISLETRHRLSDGKENVLSTCLDASTRHRVAGALTLPTPTPQVLGTCLPSPAPPPGITGSSEASTKISHTELSCLMPGSLGDTTILFLLP